MSMTSQVMIDALSNEDDWKVGSYTATHTPSGMEFWVANGVLFFDLHAYSAFGFFQRFRLWKHYKKMLQRKLDKKIMARSSP